MKVCFVSAFETHVTVSNYTVVESHAATIERNMEYWTFNLQNFLKSFAAIVNVRLLLHTQLAGSRVF